MHMLFTESKFVNCYSKEDIEHPRFLDYMELMIGIFHIFSIFKPILSLIIGKYFAFL